MRFDRILIAIGLLFLSFSLGSCSSHRRYPGRTHGPHSIGQPYDIRIRSNEWVASRLSSRQTLYSARYNQSIVYSILYPASYNEDLSRSFPVVYWLHGANGNQKSLNPLAARFEKAMSIGLMNEAIVIFPESDRLKMWVDSKDGTYPIESILVNDLIPHIRKTNRISGDRQDHYIAGFSMGGYGAARIGLKFPNIFGNVVMIGAGTLNSSLDETPRASSEIRDRVMQSVYGNDPRYFFSNSPRSLASMSSARSMNENDFKITIIVGTKDETYRQNYEFDQHLRALGYKTRFIPLPGVSHSLRSYIQAARKAVFESL